MDTILADDIFNCIFLNENDRVLIPISLKYVPRSQIDNKPALVQVIAWRWTDDNPLTLKRLGHFFQNVILFSNVVHY